jgi:hypothetical protein
VTVDLRAGWTGDGRPAVWVSHSIPVPVRALQIMAAMESEDLGLRTMRPDDLGLSSTEADRLSGQPLLFARTEG